MSKFSRVRLAMAGLCLGAAVTIGSVPASAEDITYLLPAPLSLPAFGPFVLAQQRGYFKAEGLNVTFQVGKGGVDVAKQVGAGNAVIGGGIGDTPIIVRPNGVPVKAVAVLGGGALMQLVLDKDKGLTTVKDLKGKTVTVLAYQDTTYFALLGMLASQGMTKDDVNAQAVGPVNVWKLFIAGQSDAFASTPDWTALIMLAKKNIEVIPSDSLFKSMAQAIIASDDTIKNNPQLIEKVVRATLKGMQRDVQSLSDHATYLSGKINFLLDAMLGMVTIEQNNIGFAAAIIAALPVLALLILLQRQLIRGLTAGAVKG